MDWHDERQQLLSETIAFVKRATGEGLVLAVKARLPHTPEIEHAARCFRQHHAAPKPTQLADLRVELTSLFTALDAMQRSLRFANGQT